MTRIDLIRLLVLFLLVLELPRARQLVGGARAQKGGGGRRATARPADGGGSRDRQEHEPPDATGEGGVAVCRDELAVLVKNELRMRL